jgi:cytochrome o ubiquinol oxidase subunit 1
MPLRSALGVVTAFFAVVTGFALVWHIGWMAIAGAVGAAAALLARAWQTVHDVEIPDADIAAFESDAMRRRTLA